MSASIDATRQRILLIDDDELISGSLHQYLVLHGFAVDVALTLATSEELLAANRYATVVVDPYLTGGVHDDHAELLERVCALQPHASIIVLTAYRSAALDSAAAQCRVTALLRKPQSVVSLERLIRGAVPPASGPSEYQHA
jgi:DNA-binding NtrC family response regulator